MKQVRGTDRCVYEETEGERDREREILNCIRETERERQRETERDRRRDRERDRQRETDRERQRE